MAFFKNQFIISTANFTAFIINNTKISIRGNIYSINLPVYFKIFKIAGNIVSTSVDPRLFMKPCSYDKTVYSAFMDTVCGIAGYYQDSNEYAEYPKAVLVPLKRWHYHTSKSAVKDFVYPFLPLAYFAKKRQK